MLHTFNSHQVHSSDILFKFKVSLWESGNWGRMAESGQSADSTGAQGTSWAPCRAPLHWGQRGFHGARRQQGTFSCRGRWSGGGGAGGCCWGEEGFLGEEELTRAGDEGPPSSEQQPGDRPRVHPHPNAHLPQQPPHLLQRRTQEEDVVPGQDQSGDLREPAARRSSGLVGLRGGGGRRWGGIRHHDLSESIHGNVQVLHPLPLPAIDLPPELLLLLSTQFPLRFGWPWATLEAKHWCRIEAGAQVEPWRAVG